MSARTQILGTILALAATYALLVLVAVRSLEVMP